MGNTERPSFWGFFCPYGKVVSTVYKLPDGAGLYLEVMSSGSRDGCMKYRFNEKRKRMTFGVVPAISLDRDFSAEMSAANPSIMIQAAPVERRRSWLVSRFAFQCGRSALVRYAPVHKMSG
jgi:hypothetical protein